jgi:hypothetical protein
VYLHEADSCVCECFDADDAVDGNIGMGTVVSVSVKGLELGRFAARLDRMLAREVLVPASRAREKVNVKLRRVRFSEAIKALGLSTRAASRRPRRGPNR